MGEKRRKERYSLILRLCWKHSPIVHFTRGVRGKRDLCQYGKGRKKRKERG